MNIARGNRKIKAYSTGQVTMRAVDYMCTRSGKAVRVRGFILIAYFEGWQKSHAIDPANPVPFSKGRLYATKGKAWDAMKYLPNCLRLPSVCMPLARGDYYHGKLADRPADKR